MDCDVAIIGAGAAGLAAAGTLTRAAFHVRSLEATNRIGGRVFTVHDPLAPGAIELGAEFVHGRPPEIWDLIRTNRLMAYEHTGHARYMDRGRILASEEIGDTADRVLSKIAKSKRRKDESFEDFLHRSRQKANLKDWARIYIEGFNACRADQVSVLSLRQDGEAADKIDGDRAFRIVGGYDSIVSLLAQPSVELNSVVEQVRWTRGHVEVRYRSILDGQQARLQCRQLIVTVPLGVLQAGTILFDPEPAGILKAARSLQFGQVYRVTLRFREAFWEENEALRDVRFIVSKDNRFRTWWTTHPLVSPLLTGWIAGTAAEGFQPADSETVASEAIASLSRILGRKVPRPEAFYFHDWRSDPFFRGAYSYVPVNALPAKEILAKPVEKTLYFAGEAAELNGHGGTVHGAIASGLRAAALVQQGAK